MELTSYLPNSVQTVRLKSRCFVLTERGPIHTSFEPRYLMAIVVHIQIIMTIQLWAHLAKNLFSTLYKLQRYKIF